jgi:hypothetical protein
MTQSSMLNVSRDIPGADRTGRDPRTRYRAVLMAGSALIAILIAGGCGEADSAAPTLPLDATTSPTASAIDACSLLTDDEVSQVLGGPVIGSGPTFGPGESLCEWEIDGNWSVTVSVGSPGTAPENRFDPLTVLYLDIADPVSTLDGAYHVGLGIIAFAVDERLNTIQVVSPAGQDASRSGAETLAPLVAQRLSAITG